MNIYLSILIASFSVLYFELKLIPLLWLRIIVYLLLFSLTIIWTHRREQHFLNKWQQIVTAIQSGEDNLELTPQGDGRLSKYIIPPMMKFKQKLRKNNFGIYVAASQISASSQQLSYTLAESNTFANQLSAEAQEMIQVNDSSQNSLAKALSSLKELVASLESANSISQKVRSAGQESEKNIKSGLTQIMDIVNGVKLVEDSTLEAVASINQFEETFQAINGILGVVDDIANQTQLLALNASIEAARAGEFGAGFGIVALEIRTLSDTCKNAVSEISTLIMKMTQDVKNITDTMKRNRGYVKNCTELSRSVETGLTLISESHGVVQGLMQESLLAAGKEYEYALDIGQQVDGVEHSFEEVNKRFCDISAAIDQQNENMVNLGILAQNLIDAEKGLSGLFTSDRNLIEENQQALQKTAEHAIQILNEQSRDLEFDSPAQCRSLLDRILSESDFMEAIWLNDKSGKFIYSNPPEQIPNGNVREWFKYAMKGEEYVSTVYISAITNAPCLTVSLPIKNEDGSIGGVIGADIKIVI